MKCDDALAPRDLADEWGHEEVLQVIHDHLGIENPHLEQAQCLSEAQRRLFAAAEEGDCAGVLEWCSHHGHEPHSGLNCRNKFGRTPLMVSTDRNELGAAAILLDEGADVDLSDSHGWNALMLASRHGYAGMLALLLDNDAKTAQRNFEGQSAREVAQEFEHDRVYEIVLEQIAKNRQVA